MAWMRYLDPEGAVRVAVRAGSSGGWERLRAEGEGQAPGLHAEALGLHAGDRGETISSRD
jgi:hypothetical protein